MIMEIGMTKQEMRYHMAMAGEYFVAAQLQRLGFTASVMYGNAKRADVLVFSDNGKVLLLEVKTSSRGAWVIGNRVPEADPNKIWVFVHLPIKGEECPEFFVMTQAEIHHAVIEMERAYNDRYRKKHNKDYSADKPGVANLQQKDALKYKNRWDTIGNLLNNFSE